MTPQNSLLFNMSSIIAVLRVWRDAPHPQNGGFSWGWTAPTPTENRSPNSRLFNFDLRDTPKIKIDRPPVRMLRR
jgi:hypothetical protein